MTGSEAGVGRHNRTCMTNENRTELEALKRRQELLESELRALGSRIQALDERISDEELTAAAMAVSPATTAEPQQTVKVWEGESDLPHGWASRSMQAGQTHGSSTPGPGESTIGRLAALRQAERSSAKPAEPPPLPPLLPQTTVATPESGDGSFEMRLGTYWLVRVGVVMLLTGLVFFGNVAYQNFISKLGPGSKVMLLYLTSFGLLGVGAWWQRKAARETLRNYAQVVFAGGLAAGYFTTYAAHHVQNLKVIGSPLLDGLLLLAWAGIIVWIADRKKSEVLAMFAVILAYYTSVITRVGSFTLLSNTILTGAALFFLVRNRWAALSYASVCATYLSYGYWRFFDGTEWRFASPEEGLWVGTWFLICYWALFTAAVFVSRSPKLAGTSRASFLTLNNGAFFALFLLTMAQSRQGGVWAFFLMYGAVLLALSHTAKSFLPAEPLARNAYLVQGLVLVTSGLVAKFSGVHLGLMLATQSVVLLVLGHGFAAEARLTGVILRTSSAIAAGMAVIAGMTGLRQHDPGTMAMGAGVGLLVFANAVLADRKSLPAKAGEARPAVLYYAAVAMLMWVVTTHVNTSAAAFPLVVLAEGVLLTLSIYLLRVPEVLLCAQGLILLGSGAWLVRAVDAGRAPWWSFAFVTAVNLGLGHWWPRQRVLPAPEESQAGSVPADDRGPRSALARSSVWVVAGIYAAAFVAAVFVWVPARVDTETWIALAAILGLGLTLYGLATRAWMLAAAGQTLVGAGVLAAAAAFLRDSSPWHLTGVPILVLATLGLGARLWLQRRPEVSATVSTPILGLATAYLWVGAATSIWWIFEHTAPAQRAWVLAAVGVAVFGWAWWRSRPEALPFAATYTAASLVLMWLADSGTPMVSWLNLAALVAILIQQRVMRAHPDRLPAPAEAHTAVMLCLGFSFWLFVWRWSMQTGFSLTVGWSALGLLLFVLGMLFRERIYRWAALAVLGCALGRIVLFDVWKLGTVHRMLSFLALGVVLLVLGFLYNRYQEKIRQWL